MLKLWDSFDGPRFDSGHLHQIKLVAYVIPSGGDKVSTCYEYVMEFTQLARGYVQIFKC